jgi:subtilisin family serine protease
VQRDFSGDGDGDRQGHGTHCAGTIFGRDVNGVRIGVARGVDRALIGKVLGDTGGGDSEMIFRGMQWALTERADIISMSLGFDFPGMVAEQVAGGWPAELATSNALEAYRGNLRMFDAIMQLTRARSGLGAGAIVVAAAGNESRREDDPEWRIAASLPAAAEDVISVAAIGRDGAAYAVAGFSNTMPTLSAPGVDVLSAQAGGGLVALSGTSMACPHVAGVAALWWEALTETRIGLPALVKAKLLSDARSSVFGSASGDDSDIGFGLVTAPA